MIFADDAPDDTTFRASYSDEVLDEQQGDTFWLPAPIASRIVVNYNLDDFREVTLRNVLDYFEHTMMKG